MARRPSARAQNIVVRTTIEDRQKVMNEAAERGLTISEYVRQAIGLQNDRTDHFREKLDNHEMRLCELEMHDISNPTRMIG